MSFQHFGLPAFIEQSLTRMQITTPTPIQEQSIPVALAGHDILASAQTGSGKTIAYLLPMISKLLDSATGSALILAPTRELADQIKAALQQLLGRSSRTEVALLIGGAPFFKQLTSLRRNPRFIIGTPGRINDHLSRGTLNLKETKFLILDETDRMLDMGFTEDLEKIVKHLPQKRQTLMFSATMPPNIIRLSQKYLSEPQQIAIGNATQPCAQIHQKVLQTKASEKFSLLLKELDEREGSVIIFVKTKIGAAQLADRLRRQSLLADAIHGDLKQRQREYVIRSFRNEKYRIMVATDIAARGLDIPHIMHVINYDLPQCAEDYIHRIGRTGRAGMEGHAISFVAPEDKRRWFSINRLINPEASKERSSFKSGPRTRPGRDYSNPNRPSRSGRSSGKPGSSRSQSNKPYRSRRADRNANQGRD